jgi:hypothetical protein
MECGCPDNYVFNEDSGLCEFVERIAAELNTLAVLPPDLCTDRSYMRRGTLVFPTVVPSQYPLIGVNQDLPLYVDANDANVAYEDQLLGGDIWMANFSAAGGRLNQAGIGLLAPINDWQGYAKCITVGEGDTISIAIAATDGFRILINGVLAVYYKPGYGARVSDYMHVFPFQLSAGDYTIQCEGISGFRNTVCTDVNGFPVQCDSPSALYGSCLGGFAFEVFKNVTAQILSNIKDQDGLNYHYAKHTVNGIESPLSSMFLKGSPTDTGVHGNYICSGGYLDNSIAGAYYCKNTLTAQYGTCCFTLTNCATGDTIITNTNLNLYVITNQVITIEEQPGCFLVTENDTVNCPGAISVTVKNVYASCVQCTSVYYKLVDCTGNSNSLYTVSDLSEYVGKIITIEGYSVCWIVVIHDQLPAALMVPTIVSSHNTCEECL